MPEIIRPVKLNTTLRSSSVFDTNVTVQLFSDSPRSYLFDFVPSLSGFFRLTLANNYE